MFVCVCVRVRTRTCEIAMARGQVCWSLFLQSTTWVQWIWLSLWDLVASSLTS